MIAIFTAADGANTAHLAGASIAVIGQMLFYDLKTFGSGDKAAQPRTPKLSPGVAVVIDGVVCARRPMASVLAMVSVVAKPFAQQNALNTDQIVLQRVVGYGRKMGPGARFAFEYNLALVIVNTVARDGVMNVPDGASLGGVSFLAENVMSSAVAVNI